MFQIVRHSLLIAGFALLSPTLLWAQEEFITDSTTQEEDTLSSYHYKALKKAGNQLFEEGSPYASLHYFETALNKVKGKSVQQICSMPLQKPTLSYVTMIKQRSISIACET